MVSIRKQNYFWHVSPSQWTSYIGPGYFLLFFHTVLTMVQLILLLTVNPNVVLLFVLLMSSCLNELILECAQFLYLSRNPFMSLWKYCFETSPHRDGISRSLWRLAFFFFFLSTQTNLGNYHPRHKDDSSGNVRKVCRRVQLPFTNSLVGSKIPTPSTSQWVDRPLEMSAQPSASC